MIKHARLLLVVNSLIDSRFELLNTFTAVIRRCKTLWFSFTRQGEKGSNGSGERHDGNPVGLTCAVE